MSNERHGSIGRIFHRLSAVLLGLIATAKLVSATGTARILSNIDPVFGVETRTVLLGVMAVEYCIAIYLLIGKNTFIKHLALFWLSFGFLFYRMAIKFIAPGKACPCLGTVTEKIPLSPFVIDTILNVMVGIWLAGGSLFLLQHFRLSSKARPVEMLKTDAQST